MNKTTTQYTAKLVRDLQVGDVIHRDEFNLNEEFTHVTIRGIDPYGTSFHSLLITGEYVWCSDDCLEHYGESVVLDEMTKVRIVNPQH